MDAEIPVNADALTYPFAAAPQPGSAREIAPGVLWLRMPLPMALDHINVWALAEADGWTVIDTGMHTGASEAAWQKALAQPLGGRPVRRVVCTHMHPDHVGMAGWLTHRFDCPLWMTRLEYVTCRMLVGDTQREAPPDAVRFYQACGWDAQALAHYQARFGSFGKRIFPLPSSFQRISDGDTVEIGGRPWRALIGRGHSPEHLCLYCPELALLISGDQVLPRISSNVSVFPTEPAADPLAEWLASLSELRQRIPDEVLVLPAHNEPFRGLHARLEKLTARHEQALARVLEALGEPQRVIDLFALLFRRPIAADALTLATGETLAHLNYLQRRGHITRELRDGVCWYQTRTVRT